MPGWRTLESNLNVSEYAKQVCKEIGWPYSGNLTLLCDCITSFAHMQALDVWGGFISLMETVEYAKRSGIRVDRWFFQDGKYARLRVEPMPEQKKKPESSSQVVAPIKAAQCRIVNRRVN